MNSRSQTSLCLSVIMLDEGSRPLLLSKSSFIVCGCCCDGSESFSIFMQDNQLSVCVCVCVFPCHKGKFCTAVLLTQSHQFSAQF